MVSSKPGLPEIALSSTFELLGDESSNGSWSLARARERATGRIVAIQRPVKGLDESRRARFSEEIAAAKELGHEGLVAVLAAGRDVDSGEWFCAVEPPSGVRLSDRLALGPLVEADLYALARRLAEALAHAHAKNLPLGGISPQNVLVTETGGAIIRGLGASRIGAPPTAPRGDDPYLDRDESGVEREPSFSGDLRSFGKLLFHAATGETPDSVALGLLPAWLRPIVARCIGDGPDRFARGGDVVAALLPLANRFTAAASHAGAARDVLSITLSPSRRSDAATPTPPSSATPAHLRATDGEGTPGSPFPWQPLHAQYDVEAQPRSGGMGTVLKARDRATGREVAIKRIRRDMLGSESVAQRFRREAKSIARLNHPHILSLLHCARDDDGDYLVLEWAEGGSLRDRLTRFGKLPLAEVIAIARKIGGALVHAHGKGVIHRDIKPHNVLLTEAGEPKLADFGLARGVGDLTAESSHAGAGTPLYIAPEQWKESRQADARSDLYSFAKMLYHLATGDAPSSIEAERIPRPLRVPLLGALRDRPEDRWPDVARFLLELERAVGSKPGFPTRKALVLLGVTIAAGAISAWLRGVVGDAVSDRDEAAPASRRAGVSSDRDASPPADETGTEKAVAAADPAARGSPEATGARAPRGNDSVVTPGAEPSPTTPAPPPAPRPPADTAPPSIEYTATDGAPLPERVVTHAASFLFVAKAGDDVAVVEATQLVEGPGREPSSEPVSTMALRGGTTTEIALPSLGEHRFELRARDEAGNVTIRPLVIERRGDFPDSLDALFASITPRPGSKLATPNFELALALAPAMRDARVTIVPDAESGAADPPLGFDEDGKLVRAVAFAPDAARIAWTFRFEGEFRDAREVTIAYTFLRGRPPHPDASRFVIVEGAASEERYPRRIRHVATGIDLLLVDDLVVDGSPRAPFYVAPCEVSIAEYRAFDGFALAKGGATLDRSLRSRHAQEAGIETPLPDWPEIPIQDVMPATFVSHLDAHAFCERFEFTLLDEPTWRALAGKFQDDGLYSNFASSDANAALKFTESCGPDGWAALAPTAIFRPERRGIRCLWGNVSEWLARDPDGSPTRAAGGSWIDRSEDVAKTPVVTLDGATRSAWIGFRVAYSPR